MITEIEYNITLVLDHLKMWDPYAHIWQVDKDEFMKQYREEKHTAADFDALIINYSNLANSVQILETINQVLKDIIIIPIILSRNCIFNLYITLFSDTLCNA